MDGRLDEPGETDRFLFQADEGIAYQIKAVWDSLPSIRVDIYDAYIRDGFPTFGKVKEASREPFRLVWTVPESGKYNLDVSSGDDLEQRDRFLYGLRLDRYRATGPANQRAVRTGGFSDTGQLEPRRGSRLLQHLPRRALCLRVSAGRGR